MEQSVGQIPANSSLKFSSVHAMGPQLKEVGNQVYRPNSYHLKCNIHRLLLELKGYGELANQNRRKMEHKLMSRRSPAGVQGQWQI